MPFAKDEIIESSIILDILKLTMLVYYFKVDFIFDLNNDTSTLLKNINFNELKLPNLQKNIFREICENSPHGKLVHFYDNKNNDSDANTDKIIYIPCRHIYHEKCIKPVMILESKLFRFSCILCYQKIPLNLMLYSLKNPYYHSHYSLY